MALTDKYSAASYIPDGRSDLQIELYLSVEGWDDENPTGVVRHQVLRRAGAIHQQPVIPPRAFVLRGAILGDNVRTRYVQFSDVVRAYPFGLLIHPRFSSMYVALLNLKATENPGDAIDVVEFTLTCEETGLRDRPRPTPSALAAQANTRADDLVSTAQRDFPDWLTTAQTVQARAQVFGAVMEQASSVASLLDLQASLGGVRTAVDAMQTAPQPLRSKSIVVFGVAIDAYNRAIADKPAVIDRPLPAAMLLPVFCADKYGAAYARAMAKEIRALNPSLPPVIPAGYRLLYPDPAAVLRGALV